MDHCLRLNCLAAFTALLGKLNVYWLQDTPRHDTGELSFHAGTRSYPDKVRYGYITVGSYACTVVGLT